MFFMKREKALNTVYNPNLFLVLQNSWASIYKKNKTNKNKPNMLQSIAGALNDVNIDGVSVFPAQRLHSYSE